MRDDEFERELERRRAAKGESIWITVLNPRSGDVTDMHRDEARRDIAAGKLIETVPSDPEHAKGWLLRMRERVMDKLHDKGIREPSSRMGFQKSMLDVFRDFDEWCGENGHRALPVADANVVVRYLLSRRAEGVGDSVLVNYANIIAVFHNCTDHPSIQSGHITRWPLDKLTRDSFTRAISFAKRELSKETLSIYHDDKAVARRAMRMFPDGDVPRHWHEVAA